MASLVDYRSANYAYGRSIYGSLLTPALLPEMEINPPQPMKSTQSLRLRLYLDDSHAMVSKFALNTLNVTWCG